MTQGERAEAPYEDQRRTTRRADRWTGGEAFESTGREYGSQQKVSLSNATTYEYHIPGIIPAALLCVL